MVGWGPGLLLTGSVFALLYGYLVRYFAVAYQSVEAGLGADHSGDGCERTQPRQSAARHVRPGSPSGPGAVGDGRPYCWCSSTSMKELPATLVLRPFNFDTLAVAAYQWPVMNAWLMRRLPALTIVAAGVFPVALLSRAIARATGSRARVVRLPILRGTADGLCDCGAGASRRSDRWTTDLFPVHRIYCVGRNYVRSSTCCGISRSPRGPDIHRHARRRRRGEGRGSDGRRHRRHRYAASPRRLRSWLRSRTCCLRAAV